MVVVTDYEARAEIAKERFFSNEEIPRDIKNQVQRFLYTYQAGAARRIIFFEKLQSVARSLSSAEDLEDVDTVNKVFYGLRQRYAPASYHSIVMVTRQFVRWLHEGEMPKSFRDVRPPKKHLTMRNLQPADMVTWKDAEELAKFTQSIQIKAVLFLQLDCGFRPSEACQLKFGDLVVRDDVLIVRIREGKTGSRIVLARRCLTIVQQWLEHHPTRNSEDPLWVIEYPSQSRRLENATPVEPYAYTALSSRIKRLGKLADFQNPLDFYNLRHSSCVLDKLDNLPNDLAAERHGHSIEHYTSTYGRLSAEDMISRFNNHYRTTQ